jgi:Activator of Hsp90 ATPase homolog 1-like protein
MPDVKPFRVEVAIRTPQIEVWRALTEPAQVRRWFGWDYAGLDDEVELMFVTNAKHEPPARILMFEGEDHSAIEVEADGAHTVVRAVYPASLDDVEFDDAYDQIEEGWRAFLLQLRDYLERHPGKRRRTIRLTSEAKPIAVLAAVAGEVEGESRRASPHLSVTTTESYGQGLVIVDSSEPLDSADSGRVNVTITTYGLDDERFAGLRQRWQAILNELAKDVEVTA